MGYIIGSFNIQKLSYRSDKEISKNFAKIAEIIKKEKFDVVAIQEVLTEHVIKTHLIPALGKWEWAYCWASPKSYTTSSAEGYAFLWRRTRLRLLPAPSNPQIYPGLEKNIDSGGLLRSPFVARFTPSGLPGGSHFEIRLINTHILWEKPAALPRTLSDYEMRKRELQILSETVYRLFSTKRYGIFFPAYTFLLGDYNLCLSGPHHKIPEIVPIDGKRRLITVQGEKTTLKTGDDPSDPYANDYDHFSYEDTLEGKLWLQASRVDVLEVYYPNDPEAYRREVSDHVPVKLTLNLKNPLRGESLWNTPKNR